MIINNEFKPYQAFFIGTNQHSLMFSVEPTISVALYERDELVKKLDIKIQLKSFSSLPDIGDLLPIEEIKGSELGGYTALFSEGWTWVADNYINQFEELYKLKNVGNYQIIQGSKDMNENIEHLKFNGQHLKILRDELGLTQTALGKILGVSQPRIRQIEADNIVLSQQMVDKIVANFPDISEKMTLQLDWVTFTFPELSGEEVINNVLRLKKNLFLDRTTSQNFYTREFAYAGEKSLYVQDFAPEAVKDSGDNADLSKKGASLFMTGIGTRLFEKALLEQGITWRDFFNRMYQYRGHATRLDIAINDMNGLLNMNELVDAVQEDRFWSKTRSYAIHGSKQFGWTLDFGKSPFVIRLYDKMKEQEGKGKETNISTRVELELHGDKATEVINQWLGSDNLVGTTIDILYSYLWFGEEKIDEDKLKKSGDRRKYFESLKPKSGWALLTTMGSSISFTTEKKDQSIDSIESWINKYVAPSLKVIQETGRWQKLLDVIRESTLNDNQQKLVDAVVSDKMSISRIPHIY